MAYVRSDNPLWVMTDLNGLILDDTYYLFTLQNTLPYLPLNIYLDENGTVAPDPIQFQANGALPDLYWDSAETYRLEVRQGNTQSDPLIYVWNNYIPNGQVIPTPPETGVSSTDNQLTNPQFSMVDFTGTFTISASGTYNIAPGWQLVAAGSGNATITQATFTGSNWTTSFATNASYGITITNNGFNSLTLQQVFAGNGALWTGASGPSAIGPGVAINFSAYASQDCNIVLQIVYNNNSAAPETVSLTEAITTIPTDYPESTYILQTTSTTPSASASTTFGIVMSNNTTYTFTSLQLVPQLVYEDIPYFQASLQRQEDETFNVYGPELSAKPIPSYLTAWDFSLNPAQFGSTVNKMNTGANTAYYIWDQTVLFQTVTNSINTTANSLDGSLTLTAAANTQMAVIQYLPVADAYPLLVQLNTGFVSANVRCSSTVAQLINVSLYWTASTVPAIGSNLSLISSLDSNGVVTPIAGWNLIPLKGYPPAQTTTSTSTTDNGFFGWNAASTVFSSATFVAIVVSTNTIANTNAINFKSISLVPGNIATIPAPQSVDEVLRECQYYYEMSYPDTVLPGTASSYVNILTYPMQVTGGGAVYASAFDINYQTTKRATPTLTLYSPVTGTSANVAGWACLSSTFTTIDLAVTNWKSNFVLTSGSVNQPTTGPRGISFYPNASSTIWSASAVLAAISLHYVADARLGVV